MDSNYTVVYYITTSGENPVKEFLDSIEKSQKAKVFRVFQTYQLYGTFLHTKKLTGTPLWEIKITNTRILYVVRDKKSILLLHGFIKKKQKTPQKDLDIAIKRYKDWKKQY